MDVRYKSWLEPVRGTLGAAFRTLWLLFLALCLVQPIAYAQDVTVPHRGLQER